jgi:hypothetical protein
MERGGSKLVLRRGACHWKMGKSGRGRRSEAIPFAALSLENAGKLSSFAQVSPDEPMESSQLTECFDLNGESRCSENRRRRSGDRMLAGAQGSIWARR